MTKRPELERGDLVKRKKPNDDGTMFRVIKITAPRKDRRKLGLRGYPPTSEGFMDIVVADIHGCQQVFKRRDLWRVPNQPRLLKKKVV